MRRTTTSKLPSPIAAQPKYAPIGDLDGVPSTIKLVSGEAAGMTMRVITIVSAILTVCMVVVGVTGFVWAYNATTYQKTQDARTGLLEAQQVAAQLALQAADVAITNQLTVVNTSLCDKVMVLNQTLQMELAVISVFLNVTSGNTSFTEILTQTIDNSISIQIGPQITNIQNSVTNIEGSITNIQGNVTILQGDVTNIQNSVTNINGELALRIKSVDGVPGDNFTLNVDFLAGLGTAITPAPGANTVQWDNTGVVTINSIPAGAMAPGQIEIAVSGMLSLVNEFNNSRLTIDAGVIVSELVILQGMDSMHAMQIGALQTQDINLQNQIAALEAATSTVGALFNNTDMDVDALNTTLVQFITQLNMAQIQINSLQAQLANLTSTSLPTGTIVPFGGTNLNIPAGYLECNGAEYDISLYPELEMVIGNKFCTAMPGPLCSVLTKFAVPDLRGRVPVGRKASGVFMGLYGSTLGTETELLSITHLPSHNHAGSTADAAGAHAHQVSWTGVAGAGGIGTCTNNYPPNFNVGGGIQCGLNAGPFSYGLWDSTAVGTHTHTLTMVSNGGGMAHPNVQPSMVVVYMIKT